MRNLEKCPECLQRFHVEWQGKSSKLDLSLVRNNNLWVVCWTSLKCQFYARFMLQILFNYN
jgi:hypothetical protein